MCRAVVELLNPVDGDEESVTLTVGEGMELAMIYSENQHRVVRRANLRRCSFQKS